MKKIGEGYYYNVFEVNTNVVIKTIKNKFNIFIFVFFANKFNVSNTIKEYRTVLASIPKLKNVYIRVLTQISDKSVIGNPVFINDTNYKQDMVKELRNINYLDNQFLVKVVTDYSNLLKKLWSYGISDSVFNFSINCGYDKNNKLILIDFNEMTFSKNEVSQQIKDKVWLQRASYLRLTKEKQHIFSEIMNKEITDIELGKHWNTAID
jgi:hypothetical protein